MIEDILMNYDLLQLQEATSMASLMAGLASQLPGGHLDEGPLAPVGELDPATGLFYNPSSSKFFKPFPAHLGKSP